jgi:hypothetical protein
MEFDALYRERMPFHFMTYVMVFLGIIAGGMFGLLVYHLTVSPIDNEPALGWLFLTEFLIMGGLCFFVSNFRALDIFLTYQGIVIRFGRIQKLVSWADIESYSIITSRQLTDSGGWRVGMGKRGMYSAYTVIGKPRVALRLNTGRIKEVVFSTGNPEEVARVIMRQTGKEQSQA